MPGDQSDGILRAIGMGDDAIAELRKSGTVA
jgi:hypothetical protein